MQISPLLGINEVLGPYIPNKQAFGASSPPALPSSVVFMKAI